MNQDVNYWIARCASLEQELDIMKEQSIVKWHTGEPKESGAYLITTSNGKVFADYWRVFPNHCDWYYRNKFDVKAWCKLSDIEPYKEE
jgi:hypothetical protein